MKRTLRDICVNYAAIVAQIRDCDKTIRTIPCSVAGNDYEMPTCLTRFLDGVRQARYGDGEEMPFEDARKEVLADMIMCDGCQLKLCAIEVRKSLRIKRGGVLRSFEAAGRRLMAGKGEKG